jgi:hypothetical protein
MAAIYCATQKYTVNSGLGIYDLTGSHRPSAVIQPSTTSAAGFRVERAYPAVRPQENRRPMPPFRLRTANGSNTPVNGRRDAMIFS